MAEMSDPYYPLYPFRGAPAIRELLDLTNDIQESLNIRASAQSHSSEAKPSHRHQATLGKERLLRQIAQLTTNQAHELLDLLNSVRANIMDQMGPAFISPVARFVARLQEPMFRRHFWIRPRSIDPSGFLSEFLFGLRGVQSVEIADWHGNSFANLIQSCFPKKSKKP